MADKVGSEKVWSCREIARRNMGESGRPLSPVMAAAATACELAHSPAVLNARK
ncbi:MAG: hypothetical protein ACXWU1_05220 [Allosphingosinicella sp.]